jgi:hypothetical protein
MDDATANAQVSKNNNSLRPESNLRCHNMAVSKALEQRWLKSTVGTIDSNGLELGKHVRCSAKTETLEEQ